MNFSTMNFSTNNYATMNIATMNFTTMNFTAMKPATPEKSKSSWLKPPVTSEHPHISPMILAQTGTRQARPGRQTVHTSPSTYILEAEAPFCSGEIENIFTN